MNKVFIKSAVVVIGVAFFFGSGPRAMAFFNVGTGLDSNLNTVAIQSDGKILTAGGSDAYRLNSDGTLDATFNNNLGLASKVVNAIAVQSDGKILLGGVTISIGIFNNAELLRLNSDGTPDATFNTNLGTGFSSTVETTSVQSDGKILVGGG